MTAERDAELARVEVRPLTTIGTDDLDVAVREVRTPKGERLELAVVGSEARSRLDAVALEALTWQDDASFERLVAAADRTDATVVTAFDGPATATDLTAITNEFGHVNVRELATSAGPFLELDAQNMAYSAQFNATALAAIAQVDIETVGELLREKIE